jgi:2-haloacid dehalogenase
MTRPERPAAVLFDAYGTLLDFYSVGAQLEAWSPGKGKDAAAMLRDKQIEYTRLVSLSDPSPGGSRHFRSFYDLTAAALRYTSKRLGLGLSEAQVAELMGFYKRLPAFPETREVLQGLKGVGLTLGILSNGDPDMLEAATEASGLAPVLDHLISISAVRQFKTHPAAYQIGLDTLGLSAPGEVLFVSCNPWDAMCAKWFGYRVYWVDRYGWPFEEIGQAPDLVGPDLRGLLAAFA